MRQFLLMSAALSLALFTACAPSPEKVCEHMGEVLGGDEGFTDEQVAECAEEIVDEIEEECGDNTNAALRCIMKAESREDFDDCEEICEDEEE